ncbi:MAG: MFS transporter, partial [Polyangiaceae bacterium]
MPSHLRRIVATGAILCGLVVAAFEGTVVTSAMPTIARELGGMEAYSWVFSAFLLASTIGVLACGKLADAYGRRPVFIGGMLLFLLGSALCGVSSSFGELVAFRVVQGLGAGAIQPIAMTMSA